MASVALGAALVLLLAAGVAWWRQPAPAPGPGGTPRLVVDRTAIDLGDVPFETPVEARFVVTNAGDGVAEVDGTPRVTAVQGC
jgi:hypothetical protein